MYDIKSGSIETKTEDALLDMIRCNPDTPTAEKVDINVIDFEAQKCRLKWLEEQDAKIDRSKVERICAMYLLPFDEAASLGETLQQKFMFS